jgi:hypothetical protein
MSLPIAARPTTDFGVSGFGLYRQTQLGKAAHLAQRARSAIRDGRVDPPSAHNRFNSVLKVDRPLAPLLTRLVLSRSFIVHLTTTSNTLVLILNLPSLRTPQNTKNLSKISSPLFFVVFMSPGFS